MSFDARNSTSSGISRMSTILTERLFRKALIVIALGGLIFGLLVWAIGRGELANWIWAAGTAPVVIGLLVSMIRDFLAHGRAGYLRCPPNSPDGYDAVPQAPFTGYGRCRAGGCWEFSAMRYRKGAERDRAVHP